MRPKRGYSNEFKVCIFAPGLLIYAAGKLNALKGRKQHLELEFLL